MALMQAPGMVAACVSLLAAGASAIPRTTSLDARTVNAAALTVPSSNSAGQAVLPSFVSFSLEFAFFPDFAGNKSSPNEFSNNLLDNLGSFQGSKPDIRVGGNTQDYAIFNESLATATYGIYTSVSADYPRYLWFGPSYFESYQTWPNVKFTHGFNLAGNDSAAAASLVQQVPYACKALNQSNLLSWEMGNEPDLFKTSAQGARRPSSWTESDYVKDWQGKVATIKATLASQCGSDWVSAQEFKWFAPSFAGVGNSLTAVKTWKAGLQNDSGIISKFSSHNYIGGATQPGVTLANTLLNHTKTRSSVAGHTSERASLQAAGMTLDYILGEDNSLYNQGKPGLSNSFGAALWGLDFNLYCAANSIKQSFMHMGTDYRYASWQPVQTTKTTIGTKPPYYGNVAVAAALGNSVTNAVQVAHIPLSTDAEAAYAVFANGTLARLVVVNLHQYNYTSESNAFYVPPQRPSRTYDFAALPDAWRGKSVALRRLMANGSDAITGVTFDGVSYNYELDLGRPVVLANVTRGETASVGADGSLSLSVLDSSAVVVGLA